ncbi:MAG: D-alanine--D-alanine ligase [Cyclobacteriaceae bacterium]|jgi:D-alanine-D-alanine ligase|nr:D-alanine--D-alanine ligase [Cyclobacteriaceae bacterium]
MCAKKRIGILYGGRSVEHGVSINSAKNIFEFINKDLFEPVPIGISKTGQWYLSKQINKDIEQGQQVSVMLDPVKQGFIITSNDQRFTLDIVFPVLHGTDGEDGSIQGLLKALEIPMVGSSVLGSALSMNKIVAKRILEGAKLPVAKYMVFHYREKDKIKFADIKKKLGLPFMVKAANLGSSVGVSKVKKQADLNQALDEAFKFDDEILIEEFIKAREVECAILGNHPPEASLPGEIIINKKYDFYTFDAKYVDPEAVKIQIPAKLTKATTEKIRTLSIQAFNALRCNDFARVDLFLSGTKVYVNEINTIPGFTNSSMYPMMWKERGISFTDLITRLIDIALTRFEENKRIERSFQSNLKF